MAPLRHYDAVLFRNFYRGRLVWRFRPRWSGALCAVSRTCSVTLFKPACANAGHFTARNGSSRRTIVERAAFARAMIRQLSIRSSMVGAEVELQLREPSARIRACLHTRLFCDLCQESRTRAGSASARTRALRSQASIILFIVALCIDRGVRRFEKAAILFEKPATTIAFPCSNA